MSFSKLLFIFLCMAICWEYSSAQQYDPVAKARSMVISGEARFTVLTDHIIRMEYAQHDSFTDLATLTFVNRNLPTPVFTTTENNGWLIIKTKTITLHYQKGSGRFTSGNVFIEYKDATRSFTCRPGMKDKQNLKGTTRTLDGALGGFSLGSMKKLQIEGGILSRSGWTLIDDSERPLFDQSDWQWVQARSGSEVQDLYFFGYGSDYKAALFDFTQEQAGYPCLRALHLVCGTRGIGPIPRQTLSRSCQTIVAMTFHSMYWS